MCQNLIDLFESLETSELSFDQSIAKYPRLGKKKFVIIIEDVASVKTNILEDLCQILKSRLAELETCLVFGEFPT